MSGAKKGGLAFLNKKSWHTQNIRNIEKVWLREDKQREKERVAEERQLQLKEERRMAELRQLQVESGLLSVQTERLEWMYNAPMMAKKSAEEYLLGKEFKGTVGGETPGAEIKAVAQAGGALLAGVKPEEAARNRVDSVMEQENRLREDPMMAVLKRERSQREAILSNPVKMKELRKNAKLLKKLHKASKRSSKDKKEKKSKKDKKKKKSRKRSYSRSSSSDEDGSSDDERDGADGGRKHGDGQLAAAPAAGPPVVLTKAPTWGKYGLIRPEVLSDRSSLISARPGPPPPDQQEEQQPASAPASNGYHRQHDRDDDRHRRRRSREAGDRRDHGVDGDRRRRQESESRSSRRRSSRSRSPGRRRRSSRSRSRSRSRDHRERRRRSSRSRSRSRSSMRERSRSRERPSSSNHNSSRSRFSNSSSSSSRPEPPSASTSLPPAAASPAAGSRRSRWSGGSGQSQVASGGGGRRQPMSEEERLARLQAMQADAETYDQIKLGRQLAARARDAQEAEADLAARAGKEDPDAEPAKFIEDLQMQVYSGAGGAGGGAESLESRVQKYAARRQRGNADEHAFL